MNNYNSVLTLQKMVFDRISFERKGFKNDKELNFKMQVQVGTSEEGIYKVTLVLFAQKDEEYTAEISLSGFFNIESDGNEDNPEVQDLINKNAVAILMPYLRSELTLLTAQPDTESVVLPPFNINKMLDRNPQ